MFNKNFLMLFIVISIITFACYTAEAQQVVEKGLVGYWPLDKIEKDNTVEDLIGKNHGEVEGKPEPVDGVKPDRFGDALMFNGSPDMIMFGTEGFPTGQSAMTWSVWFYREQSDGGAVQYIAAFGNWPTNTQNFGVGTRGGDLIFMTQWGGEFDTFGPVVSLKEWHHVAAVYDDKTNTIYLDGVEEVTKTVPEPSVGDRAGSIGAAPNKGEYFTGGIIDEVGLYNRALSEDEVKQNFNAHVRFAVNPADKLSITWGKIKASR